MSLMYIIATWIDKIANQLQKLRKVFNDFEKCFTTEGNNHYISQEIVECAMECHLRPAKNRKVIKKCLCCTLDSNLKKYECIIFQMNTKVTKESEHNTGTWHPCLEEHILKGKTYIRIYGFHSYLSRSFLMQLFLHSANCEELTENY